MQALPEHDNLKTSEIAKIVNELIRESQRQVGDVVMYGGSTIPENYLSCDGSAISRTNYKLLFSTIGTTFGIGDGSTTFNIPDFRGVFPKGAGTTTRAAGVDALGNSYAGTIGTYSQDKFQGHLVDYNITTGGALNTHGLVITATGDTYAGGLALQAGTNGSPRTGNTTEPQSLGINFIIKAR